MQIEDRATQLAVAVIANAKTKTAEAALAIYREIAQGLKGPPADFSDKVSHRIADPK